MNYVVRGHGWAGNRQYLVVDTRKSGVYGRTIAICSTREAAEQIIKQKGN